MPDRLPSRSRHIIISGALPKRLTEEEIQTQQQKQLDNRNALLSQVQAISTDYYSRMLTSAALRNRDTEHPPTKPHPFSRNRHSTWALQWRDSNRIFRNKGYEQYDLDYTVDRDGAVVSANRLVVNFGETKYVKPKTKITIKTDKQKYITDVIVKWKDDLGHYDIKRLLSVNTHYDDWPNRHHESAGEDFVEDFCSFSNSYNLGEDFMVKDGYSFRLDNDPRLSIYRFVMFIGVWPMRWKTTFHYDHDNNQFIRSLNDKDNERCRQLGVSDDDTMKVDTYLSVLRETLGLIRATQ